MLSKAKSVLVILNAFFLKAKIIKVQFGLVFGKKSKVQRGKKIETVNYNFKSRRQ